MTSHTSISRQRRSLLQAKGCSTCSFSSSCLLSPSPLFFDSCWLYFRLHRSYACLRPPASLCLSYRVLALTLKVIFVLSYIAYFLDICSSGSPRLRRYRGKCELNGQKMGFARFNVPIRTSTWTSIVCATLQGVLRQNISPRAEDCPWAVARGQSSALVLYSAFEHPVG